MANVGPGEMTSTNLDMFDVLRTTTDKLEEMMNGYDEPWKVHQITHVGGRDWVVIARAQWSSLAEKCEAFSEDLETWDY